MSHQGVRQRVVIVRFTSIRVHRQNMNFYICHFQSLTTFKATHGIDMWEVKHYNFARQSLSFLTVHTKSIKGLSSQNDLWFLSCQSRAILPKTIQTWNTFCRHILIWYFSWFLTLCNYTVTRHFYFDLIFFAMAFDIVRLYCDQTLSATNKYIFLLPIYSIPIILPCQCHLPIHRVIFIYFETIIFCYFCYFCPSILKNLSPPRPAHLLSPKP